MNSIVKVRLSVIFFFFSVVYCFVIAYLLYLQVFRHEFFTQLAHQQYYFTSKTAPIRGAIYDRYGHPLALNKEGLAAFIVPKQLKESPQLLAFLTRYFPESIERLHKNRSANFMYIKRRLTEDELKLIEKSGLADLKLLAEPCRFYPRESTAQVVGITNIDNSGQSGIEYICDEQLAGAPTTICLSKDARSGYYYFSKECTQLGKQGEDIHLTLDADLQFFITEELKEIVETFSAQEAAAIIMDPKTGDILAMASYPFFDPNDTRGLSLESTKNKCATESYEVGSVIKPFVALALLADNLVTITEEFDCENTRLTFINKQKMTTWKPHGILPFNEIVQFSNNIGLAKAALRLGSTLYDHYKKLGFSSKTGLDWPAEQTGYITPPHKWSKRSLLSLSFGYEISLTLVQLARAFSVIANGGFLITPRVMKSDDVVQPQRIYDPEAIKIVQSILRNTVNEGTARQAQIAGYEVMGKTGTATMLIDGVYSHSRSLFTFVGSVEKAGYNRVIVTFVKDAPGRRLFASQVAAPLFGAIAKKMIIHEQLITQGRRDNVYSS